jgi:hypothetical protein
MNIFRTASSGSLSSQASSIGDLATIVPDQEPSRIGTRFTYAVGERTIVLAEDTGSGCGGKAWEAAVLMCDYLQWRASGMEQYQKVLELGSGTGFVGIVALGSSSSWKPHVTITDLDIFVPLIEQNVELNLAPEERSRTLPAALHWGEPLSETIKAQLPCDLILLSDCVYLESLFDMLVDTLCDLTAADCVPGNESRTEIWIAYKKRRKADKRFWTKLGKKFHCQEVTDFPAMGQYRKGSLYLYRVERKQTKFA